MMSVVTSVACNAVMAQTIPADQLTISNESKTTLTELNGSKELVTDISAPHPGNWYKGTLIAIPKQSWIALTPGRYLVTYRLAVDQVGAANVSLWGEILASTPARGHFRQAWHRWLGTDFSKPDTYQDMTVTLDVPEPMSVQPMFFWRRTTKEPGDIKKIRLASITIQKEDSSLLVITGAQSTYVHYRPNEKASGFAKVLNCTDQEQTGKLQVRLFTDLDVKGIAIYDKSVTVPARSEQKIAFDIPITGKYGYELRAEILDAKGIALDLRSDYFTVTDNVLEVGYSADYPFAGDTYHPYPFGYRGTDAELADYTRRANAWADAMRSMYTNTTELFAWGPADCIKLVPEKEDWECGQTKYKQSVSRTKAFIAACHRNGIKVQLYNQSMYGCGDGGKYYQEHPEYHAYNAEGRPQGFNLNCPEPVDDHIKGLLESIKVFGWDGVRWDGHFDYYPPFDNLKTLFGEKIDMSKRDQQVAEINDKIRKGIAAQYPQFTWGHNWSDQVENFVNSKEIVSICKNNSWIMNELMKDSENPTSGTHLWKNYADRVISGTHMVRENGGLYLSVPPPQYFQSGSQQLYKGLLLYAGRAYLYGTVRYDPTPLVDEIGMFVTRYAKYIRAQEFKDVPDATKVVTVESPREIWWKGYLTEKVSPDGVEQVLGLVNPPVAKTVTPEPDGKLPAPQQNINVTFNAPKDMKKASAVLLAPDLKPFQQELQVVMKDGKARVTVPELRFWNLIYLKWSK